MKKNTNTVESADSKAKTEKVTASPTEKKSTKKAVSAKAAPKTSAAPVNKTADTSVEKVVETGPEKAESPKAVKAPAKKAAAKPKSAKPAVADADQPEADDSASVVSIYDKVGLTAGEIWHYLSENGPTPVSKLVKALSEKEAIVHRSIGWLAREHKISLYTVGQTETVALEE